MRPSLCAFVAAVTFGLTAPAYAEVVSVGPSDDVLAILGDLTPGDELVLADGLYMMTSKWQFTVTGTEEMPIVIRAADGATPHFHRPNASQNLWDISATYVEIRGLEFSGGSAGLRFEAGSHVTIEECHIHDTGDVALRMNSVGETYEEMRILRNHIHDTNGTGEGMYLGCNDDGCRLVDSLIEGNYVHDTGSGSQGDSIEIKQGSYGNVVRDNVLHDSQTGYPCITLYSTAGAGTPNVVERNVMWGCGNHGIQVTAHAIVRNNIVLGVVDTGISIQRHVQAGDPTNVVAVHNTVVTDGAEAMGLRQMAGPITIANNALYAQSGPALRLVGGDTSMLTVAGNVGVGAWQASGGFTEGDLGADFVDASFDGAPPIDVFPAAGGGLVGSGAAAHVTDDDFDGRARGGAADVGAYAFSGDGAGWVIAEAFKDVEPGPGPGTDAGPGDLDAGTSSGTDAGTTSGADAGTSSGTDSGAPGVDAGSEGEGDGGCGCRAARPGLPAAWPFAVFALLALRRRGRATARARR